MKRVIPVIHYLNETQALEQSKAAIDAGAAGVFLIHMSGDDELLVRPLLKLVDIYPNNFIGVNFLSQTPANATKEAIKIGLSGVWVDNPQVSSNGISEEARACAKMANDKIEFFGSVAFKTQPFETMPFLAAKNSDSLGWMTTTSGTGTGVAADLEKIHIMSEAVNGKLAIASGITPENIMDYLPYINTFLVATGISKDFHHFDESKLKSIISSVANYQSEDKFEVAPRHSNDSILDILN